MGRPLTTGSSAARKLDPPRRARGKRVVVVEDDDDIRESYRDILETEGFRVLTATNGREALALLEGLHGEPCLVLLDLMMPVMNGWQFLVALRKNQDLVDIPVVVVSAGTLDAEGAARVMRKPVDVESLLETVRHYC